MLRLNMVEPYNEALKKAKEELAEYDAAAEELERKRARLRQTIGILQLLLGVDVPNEQSLTGAILMILKASQGYCKATEIVKSLVEMRFKNVQQTSVATILSRLAKNGQIISAIGPDNSTGYAWKMTTTKPQRRQALKALARKLPGKSRKER
jgi:predicted transcriptional regulator